MAADQPSFKERRKFARLDIALSVSYVVKNSAGEVTEMAEAMSRDISAGGIRLMTPSPLKNGDQLEIEIGIEGQDQAPVRAQCEVVWQNKISDTSYEIGAVIKYMDDAEKKRLLEFVFRQMSEMMGLSSNNQVH